MLARGSDLRRFALGRPGGETVLKGFTLLELLIVVAIMAVATAGVSFALRDASQTQLEREAQRLAALLESARAQSRMSGVPVVWRAVGQGFAFDGLTGANTLPTTWLGQGVQASGAVLLGPEPILPPQQVRLASIDTAGRSLIVFTDGVRPFAVRSGDDAVPGRP